MEEQGTRFEYAEKELPIMLDNSYFLLYYYLLTIHHNSLFTRVKA